MQMNKSKKRKNCDPFLPLKSCLPRPEKARTTSYSLAAAQFACPRRDMLTLHPHLLPVLSSFYMDRLKWVDRTLGPSTDPRLMPSLLERLMGTPARLEEKVATLVPKWLTVRVANTWSIQKNIGHLADVEPLWQGRLADILAGAPELRPTDLFDQATNQANHHSTSLAAPLARFRHLRTQTMQHLEVVQASDLDLSARHPRLQTPMRIPDLLLFVAEHDDHHLARITALARELAAA
jgi:uncharacterized damage-inducible protein DinB